MVGSIVLSLIKAKDVEYILSSSKHLDKSYTYEYLHPFLGQGLLTIEGEVLKQESAYNSFRDIFRKPVAGTKANFDARFSLQHPAGFPKSVHVTCSLIFCCKGY
jgi:hypothetical protein